MVVIDDNSQASHLTNDMHCASGAPLHRDSYFQERLGHGRRNHPRSAVQPPVGPTMATKLPAGTDTSMSMRVAGAARSHVNSPFNTTAGSPAQGSGNLRFYCM